MPTSNPLPAITLKVWPLHTPVSMLRRSPRAISSTMSSMSVGSSSPEAKRFAVPLGTTARATSVPTMRFRRPRARCRRHRRPDRSWRPSSTPLRLLTSSPNPSRPRTNARRRALRQRAALRRRRTSLRTIFWVLATTAIFDIEASGSSETRTPARSPRKPPGLGIGCGVRPSARRPSSHRWPRSHSTTSAASLRSAASSGVRSSQPTQLMSAPRSTRYSATSRWPPWHAPHSAPVMASSRWRRVGGAVEPLDPIERAPTRPPRTASCWRRVRAIGAPPSTDRTRLRRPSPCRRRSPRRALRCRRRRRAAHRAPRRRRCWRPSAAVSRCADR